MSGRHLRYVLGPALWLLGVSLHASEWRKVETPHFTVLAQSGAASARQWATDLENFRAGMQVFFPVPDDRLEPVLVVIFRQARDYRPFVPPALARDPRNLAGFFSRSNGRNIIVMSESLNDRQMRETVFHEATHWFTSALPTRPPPWVEEGLAEVFSTFEVNRGSATIGGEKYGRYQNMAALALIPVDEFMRVPASRVHRVGSLDTAVYYAQAWLIMNLLLTEPEMGGFESLHHYLRLINARTTPAQAFAEVYGLSYQEFQPIMRRYFNERRFRSMRFNLGSNTEGSRVSVLLATEDDEDAAKAIILLQQRRPAEAQTYLQRMLLRGSDDPRYHEGMAEVEQQRDNRQGMMEHYAAAAAKGSRHYLAHFYPQLMRAQAMIGGELAADRHDPAAMREIVDSLQQAIRLRPNLFHAYETMAGLYGSLSQFRDEDRAILDDGLERFPDEPILRLGLAAYHLGTGRKAAAKRILDQILAEDHFGLTVRYAGKLQRRLMAVVNLEWFNEFIREGKYEQASELLPGLRELPLRPDEWQQFTVGAGQLALVGTVRRLREAVEQENWRIVGVLLEQLAKETIPKSLQAEIDELRKRWESRAGMSR